jgi:hypothetical protein
VILTSSNTECLRAFTPESLASIAGDCKVAVEKADPDSYQQFGRTDSSTRRIMRFRTFLSRMKDDELYCSTQPLPEDKKGPIQITSPHVQKLISHGMIPDVLPLMGNLQLYQINAWIGCSDDGTSSGYHHDFHDNFYFLVSGEKQFRIASPNHAAERPTFGCKGNKNVLVHPNGLISYLGNTVREDGARRVDVLRWKIKTSENPEEIDSLQTELEEALLDEMMLDKSTDPHDVTAPPSFCIESTAQGEYITETIRAGEMLYLPASYFHEVLSYNRGGPRHHMAINYWYYPPSSEGTYETPYEDEFWKARWDRIAQRNLKSISRRNCIPQERMRRRKLPLRLQYTKNEMQRFLKRHTRKVALV